MFRKLEPEQEEMYLLKAVEFMGDYKKFGRAMMQVIKNWQIASEQNLTDNSMNRRAWMGQSACSLAIDCPEYITRLAWWKLTDEQKILANKEADKAISKWEYNHMVNKRNTVQIQIFNN
jgi:hypothetical protein